MKNREWSACLYQALEKKVEPRRMEETIKLCTEIMRKQPMAQEEKRTSFWCYLSDIFRFEGFGILGLQALTLFIVCFGISTMTNVPENIPVFTPLFALAIIPALFRSQMYGMSEIEAATRASGAQIILAKLILAGASNLICMTVLLCLEVYLQNTGENIGQMILYFLVPYLLCMVLMLRCLRLRKKEGSIVSVAVTLCSCICWGMSAKVFPWLYEMSAMGVWIIAFLFFAAFFIKEVYFIVEMRKEGKMYGIIS